MEVVASSLGEAQGEDHMAALELTGPSYQDGWLQLEFQQQITVGACLVEVEVEVGENVIFQEVIHQPANWASSQVQEH